MKSVDRLLRELIPALRSYDLTLNEAKSKVMLKASLITEEPDLEELFSDAVEEISSQIDDEDFDADYGFQSEWDDESPDDDEEELGDDEDKGLELKATKLLFDSIEEYAGHEESIERFCLPLFAKAGSDYAVDHVKDAFKKRPAMSQIFASYLANFLKDAGVRNFLFGLLEDSNLVDWQRLWIVAALSQVGSASDTEVKSVMSILKDGDRHESLRAAAAVYVGRFGDHPRRKALGEMYASVSPYIQSAIYFSSRTWPGTERSNAKAKWASQNPLNVLVTAALAKK